MIKEVVYPALYPDDYEVTIIGLRFIELEKTTKNPEYIAA